MSFPGDSSGKEPAWQCRTQGDSGSIPELGRSPGGGHGNPLHYSCLEDPMDKGTWQATVHRVTQSQTQPRQLGTRTCLFTVFLVQQSDSVLNIHAAKLLQSCLTLCDPIDGSPPGSAFPGILQARTLDRVAISLSNAWKWKVKVKSLSHVRLFATPWAATYQAPPSMGFSRQEYWSGVSLPSPNIYIYIYVCVCVCVYIYVYICTHKYIKNFKIHFHYQIIWY